MQYRSLGNSGLKVSELSLGGWLTLGGSVNEKTSINLIKTAFHHGVNLFDMADVYSAGQSEIMLGKAAKDLPRDQMVIATKVYGRMHPGPFGSGLSKKHIIQACEASLVRLQTDYIDLYQFHVYDDSVPLEESLEALAVLFAQGKILYAGCSNFSTAHMQEALNIASAKTFPRFISNQPKYNLLIDTFLEEDFNEVLFPFCGKNGIGNIVFSPLAHGVLTGKYKSLKSSPKGSRAAGKFESVHLTQDNIKEVKRLKSIADEAGLSLVQLSFAWILRKKEVSSAIIGASSVEQLESNLSASGIELDEETLLAIDGKL